MSAAAPSKRVLLIAFFTVAIDLLGFGIIIPIQPFYAETFGATPRLVTWLGASFSLMQFIFVPFWGRLSDRIGRRPVILISVTLGIIGHVGFGLANSLPVLFAARMLSGFGNANIATAQAIIADITTGEDRAKGMGLIGAAFGLGFIFGPALGGFLGQYGLSIPAYGAAALGVVNLVFAAFMLPETRKVGAPSRSNLMPWAVLPELRRHKNVLPLIVIIGVVTTGFSLMEQAIGLYIERRWATSYQDAARLTSYLLVVIGVAATIVQGGLIGRLSKQFGENSLVKVGLIGLIVALGAIPIAGKLGAYTLLFPIGVVMAFGTGLSTPSLNSLLSRAVSSDEQGSVLGIGQSSSALGRVLGPAASGILFELEMDAPFFGGAILIALALVVAWRLSPPH